jgi:hypothetical protein
MKTADCTDNARIGKNALRKRAVIPIRVGSVRSAVAVLWPLQWRYPPNNARLTCANLIIANAAAISARVAGSLIGYRASTYLGHRPRSYRGRSTTAQT